MSFSIAMCDPHNFSIDYSINPWMRPGIINSENNTAIKQWNNLYNALVKSSSVAVCKSEKGWPDMVFFGNAGLLINNTFIPPRFTYPERQGEEKYLREWAKKEQLDIVELSDKCRFEGEADALVDTSRKIIWGGSEFRSNIEAQKELHKIFDIPVLSLSLVNDYFYHLDTCLFPLSNGFVMYYPAAFDKKSQEIIEAEVPKEQRIVVSEEDARYFACNAVQVDNMIFLHNATDYLEDQLSEHGYALSRIALDEFLKSGGSAKCLTLTRYNLP